MVVSLVVLLKFSVWSVYISTLTVIFNFFMSLKLVTEAVFEGAAEAKSVLT